MHKVYDLKENLCRELEEYGSKDKFDISDIEYIDTLAHAIKNIDKIIEKYEENGYSQAGGGRYSYDGRGYGRGSYDMWRTTPYGRGYMDRYAYNDGRRYARNDGGYSRAEDDMESMIAELKVMMNDLPAEKKHEVQKFVQRIEQM